MRIISLLLLLVFTLKLQSQVERIEPPSWWAGMKNPEFQIMLYGKDIGLLQPSIKSKGIKLLRFSSPENKNYLFLDLFLEPSGKAGEFPIELTNGKETIFTIRYSLNNRDSGSGSRKGFGQSDVIYLITPDRFANGDPLNDNQPRMPDEANRNEKDSRHGGDIEGIRQHLEYIADMGFTTIWINPVLENNMPKYSYHGYAITDFYKVDARMGTNESYKELCKEAHEIGLKVIQDQVVNHCGLSHWWMSDPPTRDWINYYQQDYVETNHRKTLQTDPYAAKEDVMILENGWFVKSMPDLNVTNPYMAQYLIQNSIWWIEFSGIDGIRMDTYLYPEEDFMSAWSKAVMTEYPNLNITGEVWYEQPAVLAYWQKGKNNPNGYKSYLPSLFDFPLHYALVKALTSDNSWGNGWVTLYETLALDFEYPDPNNMVVFADNHDMSRIYAQLDENVDKVKLALAYILTVRGIPQVYYGTEILMNSPKARDDGKVRSDFPGGWKKDTINTFTEKGLTEDQLAMKHYLQKVLLWRKNASVIHSGKTKHYTPEKGVYVYFRYNDKEQVMVVLNKNETAQNVNLDRFVNMLAPYHSGNEIISGKQLSLEKTLLVPAMQAMIIECKK